MPIARKLVEEFVSPATSPNGRSDNLQALVATTIDTGKLIAMKSAGSQRFGASRYVSCMSRRLLSDRCY